MSHAPAAHLVWIDCEMTGLDPDVDQLCEIAVIITDFDLQPVHPGFEAVIRPDDAALTQMSDFVREMHRGSGLLERIEAGDSVETVEEEVMRYVESWSTGSGKPIVAGNTIGMDRRFIAKYMPRLEERLHYRSIDVSSIKELSRRWYPSAFSATPVKQGGHRALADIAESIQELAYFRRAVLAPETGPDTATSRRIAEEVSARYTPLVRGGNAHEGA